MMEEIYKRVENYPYYEVSNCGNIRSIDRCIFRNNNGTNVYHNIKGVLLKQAKDSGGYCVISVNGTITKTVHSLVWDAFGDRPRNGRKLQVDHIDDNKENNNINNLQLLTHRLNIIKSRKLLTKSSRYIGVSWQKKSKKWIANI